MTILINNIHVFRTNISTRTQSKLIRYVLDRHPHIQQWSVDTEDVDCVLRVVTTTLNPTDIIQLINLHGFECAEL